MQAVDGERGRNHGIVDLGAAPVRAEVPGDAVGEIAYRKHEPAHPLPDPVLEQELEEGPPLHRGHGLGHVAYQRAEARAQAPERIETVVLASNEGGLAFAEAHGFVEVDRYLLPGDEVPFVDLRLSDP